MGLETFAYHQERTCFIISHLPSYVCAIRQNEANDFLKSMMGEFIARFPMDLTGVRQSETLRLHVVDSRIQHPDQMVEVAMRTHLNVGSIPNCGRILTIL